MNRQLLALSIRKRIKDNPITALLGPRQCGKSTLAQQIKAALYLDLENPTDLAQLENPLQALQGYKGLIIIDEIQRRPDLFPVLRYLVDKNPKSRFLILGSASRDLLRQSSETLAGRISYLEMGGFSVQEIPNNTLAQLWLRGSFPRAYLAKSNNSSNQWRRDYIKTFLERDIPQLGIQIPAPTLDRFWRMLSHYHGQILQFSELARAFGNSDMTMRKYADILAGTYMIQLVQPWFVNLSKRQVKQPKIYLLDSGLFHTLQSIETRSQLLAHPKLGASWEGFVLQALRALTDRQIYFWATHAGAELDFFVETPKGRFGIEAKFMDAPKLTQSMKTAIKDLGLKKLFVIYPGEQSYMLDKNVEALPVTALARLRLQ